MVATPWPALQVSRQAFAPEPKSSLAAVLPSPKRYNAARPGPYVQRRTNSIQRQMRYMGGSGWLRTLD